ncbi:hypothetical protein PPL_09280 [Heterostelium album PN500]|uniref:LIM zinc-binding domain-containing protein n=1 Tax=Heterostelium pallidum (strain ATCC 26659 / Pp 5 / PN500) TaxID=670386 RepID=D3BL48_HETP5|nr:hypothetical protein PPL_09280 [Heterostelium album PN500]EFA77782.1 hypothetical protein PPL_09280 [Heterostelium album PN500]|eukprot:XP_020429910.1 hypothetical protein PPL_09280 [Heterostelium album PN500]
MARKEDISNRYISSALHGNIDNGLSRMLGDDKKIGSLHPQFCGECGQQCKIAYPDPKDSSIIYCREHYESLVAPICEGCNRGVVGEVTVVNGKNYHPACSNEDHTCGRCSKPVIGNSLVALNKHWHSKCFTCTQCGLQLGDTYIDRNGSPFCHRCNTELQKNGVVSTGGGAATTNANAKANQETLERNKVKTDLFDNVQKGKEACQWCRKIIGPVQAVQFNGGGSALCQNCGKTPSTICHDCKNPIESTYTVAQGNKYHPQCLVCRGCRKSLEKGYMESGGNIYCGVCGKTEATKTATNKTVLTGGRTKGFTIDPRSGKKTFH